MKNDRKQIILQTLAKLLETRNPSKITTALLAKESKITEAALYRHFPSKRTIFLELFNFCDQTIRSKASELKKSDLQPLEKAKNLFFFLIMFVEKNKGFARILSREALGPAEKNVIDAVNQFFKSLELTTKQLLGGEKKLVAPPGFSAQFIVTNAEGIISRFIRSEFKDAPSSYLENQWNMMLRTMSKG
tara:strand:+ start:3878 stop:4444 length:567 start_codon:yes stop_codon:yes gene_type:complete